MDWTPGELSSDIEDQRGSSGGGGFGGGGLGIVGFLILLVISLVTGRNYIGSYLSGGGAAPSQTSRSISSPAEDRSAHLVSWTLDDVQHTWETLLPQQTGRDYRRAKLVLFRDYTQSGCGVAQSQTGPFYWRLGARHRTASDHPRRRYRRRNAGRSCCGRRPYSKNATRSGKPGELYTRILRTARRLV
jgi:predicted metalloprotease